MGTAITFTLVLLQGLVLTKNFKDNTEGHVPNKAEHSVYIFFKAPYYRQSGWQDVSKNDSLLYSNIFDS